MRSGAHRRSPARLLTVSLALLHADGYLARARARARSLALCPSARPSRGAEDDQLLWVFRYVVVRLGEERTDVRVEERARKDTEMRWFGGGAVATA